MGIPFETPPMASAGIFSAYISIPVVFRPFALLAIFEGYFNPNFPYCRFDTFCSLSVTWNQGKTTVATDVGNHSGSGKGGIKIEMEIG